MVGRRIMTVFEGGPGHAAGLSPFDEVVALDGYRIEADFDVRKRLVGRRIGDPMELSVFRRDRLQSVSVPLGRCPARRYQVLTNPEATADDQARFTAWLGQPFPKAGSVASKFFGRWL
jgi:predicted metalloprotease with PDZ domain